MKLVSIHKQFVTLLIFAIGIQTSQAQVWSLQQCIDTAQVHNKNLQMSRNSISIGEQKAKEAKANLIPKIMVNADYRYFTNLPYQLMPLSIFGGPDGQYKEAQFGVPHNINANLQLAIPLYSPQVYGAIQTTKIASELTELQYQKTEEQLYFETSNLYYNAQILHHQLAFIDSNLVNAVSLLNIMQLLNEQLLAKGTDVSKVKLQVSQLNTQKEIIASKYDQVLNALKFSIGISIERIIQIDTNIEFLSTNEYLPSLTLDNQIVKTHSRLLSNELSILRKSKYLPSLNIIGTYGTTGFGYDKKPNDFLKFYAIGFAGIQLSYPLFNGTVTQRKINQKKFELLNNDLQFEWTAEQNNIQIENAKRQRVIAKKAVENNTEQIELAKNIYEKTILQQRQGTANLTDVLLADNSLRDAQQTFLSAVVDYLKADLELKKLTGNISTTK